MGIKVTDGRDFRPEDDLKDTGCYIFNEKAREMYDLELGDKIDGGEIIGFMPNIKVCFFRNEVSTNDFLCLGENTIGEGKSTVNIMQQPMSG